MDEDFKLFGEYMDIYIQLLPYCVEFVGIRISKVYLPTFEYFKENYNSKSYSLSIPHYKESKAVYDKKYIGHVYTHGLGSEDGIGYRYYNYWKGCKFFTGGNIEGNFMVNVNNVNNALKQL